MVNSDGTIDATKTVDMISLSGASSIIGHALVLHQQTDDCRTVPSNGNRLGYCVIGIQGSGALPNSAVADTTGPKMAHAKLSGTAVAAGVSGDVWLTQDSPTAPTLVVAKVLGITGKRAFHLHQFGQLS